MTQEYSLDVTEFIKLNLQCIHYLAYFPLRDTRSKICYQIRSSVFITFAYVLCVSSEMANMIAVFGNIEKMTSASFVLLTNLVHSLKLYCFIRHGPKIKKLVKNLNRKEFKPRSLQQHIILSQEITTSKRITKIFLIMCLLTCSLWAIFPLLDKTGGGKIRLPLSGWYPFNTEKTPVFEIIYTYQILATCCNGLRNISMDTFMSGIIMAISGQLGVLNNSFQTLGEEVENSEKLRRDLIKNIVHYRSILKLGIDAIQIFNVCLTGQIVVSVVVICITMFQMSLVSPFTLQFASMAVYQACLLMEIFLWCYYGNEVILKSTEVTKSAYSCKWIHGSKNFKQDLLFFMIRSQISMKLCAGGYFTLSLETFMTIVKSSWSYFAVLNRVNSAKV